MADNDITLKDQAASPQTFFPESKDLGNGIRRSMQGIADGANVTQGAKADAAWDGSAASPSMVGILKAIWTRLGSAVLGASEAHIGALGGHTGVGSVTPTVQASAYATGNVIGGKQTISGMARVTGGTGVIQTADVFCKVANTAAIDLLVFHADPTASTFTDKAALAVAAADFDKLSGVIHVTDWTSLGTPSVGQALGVGMAFKLPAGVSDAYVVPVARGAITFASTGDLKIALKTLQD